MTMWPLVVEHLLLFLVLTGLASSQAPGDEADRCTVDHTSPPVYPDNERTLMDSYSYVNLLPGNGTGQPIEQNTAWNDMSYDDNDIVNTLQPTYWQQGAGGICRYQVRVCGFKLNGVGPVVIQNNWLFTQHISKDFDPSIYNYPVTIRVQITYAGQSCRERNGCNPRFSLLTYITNTERLPSTLGNGFMNRNNYGNNVTILPERTSVTYIEIHNFTLQPNEMGLYLAVHDYGTCLGISRLRVYRNNCQGRQTGLVVYPDAPAPVSGSVNIKIACVDNAVFTTSDEVTCDSDGTWGPQTPECQCSPGYEFDASGTQCVVCPEGMYQALISNTEQCKQCPAQSSSRQPGTAVCACDAGFIRHPDRPDDPCVRSPSAPRFDLNNPPVLGGTDVTLIWLPSADTGGDPDNLYYDVYAAQLDGGDPVFCRQNEEQIDRNCNKDCSFKVTGLNEKTPYALLVVAANSGTDDPQCVTNITVLGSRYLVMVVGTEDSPKTGGLSSGSAGGIAFGVTFAVTAIITAVIVVLVMYCLLGCRRSQSKYSTGNGVQSQSTTAMVAPSTLNHGDSSFSPPSYDDVKKPEFGQSKPPPPMKPYSPSRPAAPPKPFAPPRPNPPSKPPHASYSNNGY